jgi:hypothetical protein
MKESTPKKRTLWFTIINGFLFLTTIIVTYITLAFGTVAGQVDTGVDYGWMYLITYTVQSNILLGIVALIGIIYGLRNLKKDRPIPRRFLVLYLTAAAAAMLTALTVIFFLAPARVVAGKNYFDMLLGPMFFFHFFNPFLSAAAFIYLTPAIRFAKPDAYYSIIPPVLYAIPYILNVVILKGWPDFYGFTFGGNDWAIIFVFLVIATVITSVAYGLVHLHNHRRR